MSTRAPLLFLAVLGLGSAFLGAAGCGPTCPASEPNCGTANSSVAGAAGSGGSATCTQLTALRSCMDAFCATADLTNPFCNCYKMGKDLNIASSVSTEMCSCVPFDATVFCADQARSGATYDCSAAIGAVGTACVGVE